MTDKLDLTKITVGQELAPIQKYMTQEKINAYIDAAEDYNPIHVDPEYAKNTVFKSTIAP
ncbi:MAG: MaoC family dehydratase, partial [Desulfobacterales bacterium]|nr:MaoC family dehydratase [Desulfobacterales bacterium]